MGIPCKLSGGANAVILWDSVVGDKPIIGAYETLKGWIPISWTSAGKYVDKVTTLLDIVEDEAKEKIKKAPI